MQFGKLFFEFISSQGSCIWSFEKKTQRTNIQVLLCQFDLFLRFSPQMFVFMDFKNLDNWPVWILIWLLFENQEIIGFWWT